MGGAVLGSAFATVFRLLRGSGTNFPGPPSLPALPEAPELSKIEGYDEIDKAVSAPPKFPEVPSAPASWLSQPTGETASPGRSYSSTFDVSVACLPCLQQHSSGAAAAMERAKAAADAGDIEGAKLEALRALGEVAAFRIWDLTAEKLKATPPDTLEAIKAALGPLSAMADVLPAPPVPLLGAYAGIAESPRFARGAPTEHDRAQIAERLLPALQWFGEFERVEYAPDRLAVLPPEEHAKVEAALAQVREARHLLGEPGTVPSAQALEQASEHLLHATAALTPDPTPEQVAQAAEKAKETIDALDGHLRAKIVGTRLGA